MKEADKFEPMGDFMLVKPTPRGETAGGLALPDGVDPESMPKGTVTKVGPGRITEEGAMIEPRVQEGNTVYMAFAYAQPFPIKLDNIEYIVVRERDVIARVKD